MAQVFKPIDTRPTYSDTLRTFSAKLRYEELPAAAIERVKHFFIDHLAIALHASTLDSSQPVRALARVYPIPGKATLLGRPDAVSPYLGGRSPMARRRTAWSSMTRSWRDPSTPRLPSSRRAWLSRKNRCRRTAVHRGGRGGVRSRLPRVPSPAAGANQCAVRREISRLFFPEVCDRKASNHP